MDNIKNSTPKELATGIIGYYAHGEKHTLGLVELKKGSNVPMHSHIHEQITFILEGQMDMTIDGKACLLTAGMYHIIHSNVPHSATAITDCKVIDTFAPAREEYK